MKTDMPHKLLEYVMRENIARDIPYSTHLLYKEYKDILNRDKYINEFSIMSETSFVKRIGEWSKPGKWLIKEGRGKDAIYSKRACRSKFTWAQIRDNVRRCLLWGK